MSSFIIDINEYRKVGAFIGAFTEMKNRYNEPLIYYYDLELGRLKNCDDVIKDFERVFELNVISYNEQYHDTCSFDYTPRNENEITQYKNLAKKVKNNENELTEIILHLHDFIRSANYQIENEQCSKEATEILNTYLSEMIGILKNCKGVETKCWGEFNIELGV